MAKEKIQLPAMSDQMTEAEILTWKLAKSHIWEKFCSWTEIGIQIFILLGIETLKV